MPFTDEGKWVNPGKIKARQFIQELEQKTKKTVEIPSSIRKHFDTVFEKLTDETGISSLNSRMIKSLQTILEKGIQPVDIVLPVYNGLHVLKLCVDSVLSRTSWPFHLTIIDDASPDPAIKAYLETLKDNRISVIYQKKNKGFAATVNKGIRSTSNPYVCILNSDVIVTKNWMIKMIFALENDPRNMIVNPVTNNTALINVPMQENFSYLDMNEALEKTSTKQYPTIMPTGFCLLLDRILVDCVGPLDEGFTSYGEDTDLWMKAISNVESGEYKKWRAVLADDTYIFHERSSSFSEFGSENHMSTRKKGSERFHALWPGFSQWQKTFNINEIMQPLRETLPSFPKRSPYNVSFITHSTAISGGMAVISDIVNELIERRINVNVSVIKRKADSNTPIFHNLRMAPTVFESYKDFIENFSERVFSKGTLIAATGELISPILDIKGDYKRLVFAQSDDLFLVQDSEEIIKQIEDNYKNIDNIISGSEWLDKKLRTHFNRKTLGFIRPGIDPDLFHPRDRSKGDERPTVLFSLLKTYKFKGYDRGVKVAKQLLELCKRNNKEIRILAYGILNDFDCPEIIGLGGVSQPQLAKLLSTEVDVFCDPSYIHSYGLTSLEALACGATPICWDNKGIREYTDSTNSIILPEAANSEMVSEKIYDYLFTNKEKFTPPKNIQIRKDGVNKFISILESYVGHRNDLKEIAIITPHLRKHGGPTTILHMAEQLYKQGHGVKLYTIYPDINPEVIKDTPVPIRVDWKNISPCDVLLTNSDNEHNQFFSEYKDVKRKVLLKLSHNERFYELENNSLNMKWDNIITSTKWLKDACENPLEGWAHPPQNATRVGWYHYAHETFSCPPNARTYGTLQTRMTLAFLAHQHPLKGTTEAMRAMMAIKQKYKDSVNIVAVGEWPGFSKIRPPWVQYLFSPNRKTLAEFLKTVDIWLTASYTEGLGRMGLEAMSASCGVVLTDTGVEYAVDGKNCLINGTGNTTTMVLNMNKLITDRDLYSDIVKNAYDTACQYADPTNYIENLNKVIYDR